ncbi:MAG: MFS transporter, partial [Actinomycetota bacterium]|nr:MFS transporter [Actinomycetota bacterium]
WAGVLVAAAVFGVWDGPLLVGTYAVRAGHGPPGAVASVFTVAASLKLGAASIGALAGGYLLDGRATAAGLVAIGVAHLAAAAVGLALCRPPGRRG